MADSISVQNLKDAKVDAGDLAEFTNGGDTQDVTSRLGSVYPTIQKVIKTFRDLGDSHIATNDATALAHLNANDATALSHLNANDATALSHLNANDEAASDQRDSIQAAGDLVLAGLSYAVPVPYASGLSMTLPTQTVQYNGEAYAPKIGDIPFTTSGTFETAKFRLIQGVSGADLAAVSGSGLSGFSISNSSSYPSTSVGKKLSYTPMITDSPYLGNGDGIASNTTPINNFINDNIEGEFPVGIFKSGTISFNVGRTVRSRSYGKTTSGKTIIRLDGDHDKLLWFANLNTSGAGFSRHLLWDGFVFDADGHSLSDALYAIEGAYQVRFQNCAFINSIGRVLRLRQVNEVSFSSCLFYNNDCSASEMVYFDQVGLDSGGNPFSNFNVNNVTFDDNCHFEKNKGTYFRTHANANLDILRFIGSKFEYGQDLSGGSADWTMFDMVNCFRFFMGSGTSFTNFRKENNYNKIFKFSSSSGELCQGGLIEATHFRGISGTTTLLDKGIGDNTKFGKGVGYQSVDDNKPLLISTSKYQNNSDDARNDNINDAGSASRETSRLRAISSHDTTWPGAGSFVVDANSRNIQGTVLKASGDGKVLADMPLTWVSGQPNAFRVGVRARSTAGTGQIRVQIGTTLLAVQTVAATYATYYFDIDASLIASLGASGSDRFRILTVGSDDYFYDQLYLINHPGPAARIPEPFFRQSLALNNSVQMPLPTAVAPNGRGIFAIGVSASINTGFSVIVEVNAGKIAVLAPSSADMTSSNMAVGNTDPGGNKFRLYLTGNVLTLYHGFTSDSATRNVTMQPITLF